MKKAFALTTLALLLGACADNTATDTGTANTPAASTPADGTAAASTPAEGGTAAAAPTGSAKKDTLVYQTSSDIPTLDPGASYDSVSASVIENVYEPLVTYKGSSLTEFEPLLATAWEVSDDGLTYRFPIREGVKFQSGNPLTCADVEYTFQRNLVTNASDSSNWFIAEPLVGSGKNASENPDLTWEKIDQAVQCDGETAVFNLVKPDPAFLAKMAYSGQSIIDSKYAKEIGEWDGSDATWKDWVGKDLTGSPLSKKPSGTGPYRIMSSDSTGVTAEAFADYWGGAPAIKNVVMSIVPEQASRIQAFLSGDADLITSGGREVMETQLKGQPGVVVVDDLTKPASFGFTMNQDLEGSTMIGSGNWGDGLPANFFQDEKIRECFTKAFDYQAYIDQVQMGKGETPNVMLPPSFLGYDSSIPSPAYDPEGAAAACQAAHGGEAWDKGFTLNASYSQNSPSQQIALEILKTNLESMNPKFKVNILGLPWSDVISKASEQPMIFVGWSPDYADPDNFISTFYASDGYYNARSGIKDPELDKMVAEARTEVDQDKRKEMYSNITKYLATKNYYLITPIEPSFSVMHSDLKGRTAETYNSMYGGNWLWKSMSKE